MDTGLDADALDDLVQVGDPVLMASAFTELLGERVAGKALDNRAGVLVMLATLKQVRTVRLPCDIVAVASVGEELTLLGGRTATYALRPDLAVVIDMTFGKQPGAPSDESFALGGGPVLALVPIFIPDSPR